MGPAYIWSIAATVVRNRCLVIEVVFGVGTKNRIGRMSIGMYPGASVGRTAVGDESTAAAFGCYVLYDDVSSRWSGEVRN